MFLHGELGIGQLGGGLGLSSLPFTAIMCYIVGFEDFCYICHMCQLKIVNSCHFDPNGTFVIYELSQFTIR